MGESKAFAAEGWMGQFAVGVPDKNIVGVRMRFPRESDYTGDGRDDGFSDFPELLEALSVE